MLFIYLLSLLLVILISEQHVEAFFAAKKSTLASSTRVFGEVYFDNNCEARLKDKNGRCPGESGFVPQVVETNTPSSFKEFQAAMAAKKRAAADALKKK